MKIDATVSCILLATVLVIFLAFRSNEHYTDYEDRLAGVAVKKIADKLVAREQISSISLTLGKISDVNPDFKQKWLGGKSVATRLSAAPKYTTANGTVIIGPSYIVVKGHGKTVAEAEADAKLQAKGVLDAIADRLSVRGLTASTLTVTG